MLAGARRRRRHRPRCRSSRPVRGGDAAMNGAGADLRAAGRRPHEQVALGQRSFGGAHRRRPPPQQRGRHGQLAACQRGTLQWLRYAKARAPSRRRQGGEQDDRAARETAHHSSTTNLRDGCQRVPGDRHRQRGAWRRADSVHRDPRVSHTLDRRGGCSLSMTRERSSTTRRRTPNRGPTRRGLVGAAAGLAAGLGRGAAGEARPDNVAEPAAATAVEPFWGEHGRDHDAGAGSQLLRRLRPPDRRAGRPGSAVARLDRGRGRDGGRPSGDGERRQRRDARHDAGPADPDLRVWRPGFSSRTARTASACRRGARRRSSSCLGSTAID